MRVMMPTSAGDDGDVVEVLDPLHAAEHPRDSGALVLDLLAFTSTNVQTLTQLSIQEIVARWSVLLRQYLYLCASKASKSSTCPFFCYIS